MRNRGNITAVSDKITDVMNRMAAKKRAYYGPPIINEPNGISAVELVFDFTAEELNIASELDNELAGIKLNILQLMRQKMYEINEIKNQEFSLIHGELLPDHIFILDNDEIGLIDVDGIIYFDIEYDWALINITFGEKMPLPKSVNVEKFEFYRLCWKIIYLSATIDCLVHVDSIYKWHRNIRENYLRDLKKMIQ